jgi:hypothetical protein
LLNSENEKKQIFSLLSAHSLYAGYTCRIGPLRVEINKFK